MKRSQIEMLREKLNRMMDIYECNDDAVLKLSKELDVLILGFLKEELQNADINRQN